jgi:ATP-dependent DNA helicase RecQ
MLNLLEVVREAHDEPHRELDAVSAVVEMAEAHRSLDRSRVEMMRAYAETSRCRSEFLIGYFGEQRDTLCGSCDNCRSGVAPVPGHHGDTTYDVQERVEHADFGVGVVTDIEDDRLTVLFEDVGYRTLVLRLAEGGLLRPLD